MLSVCHPAVCDPAEAALAVRTTLQTILAVLSGALQVIPLAGYTGWEIKWLNPVLGLQHRGGSCSHSQRNVASKDQAVKYWEGALSVPAQGKTTQFYLIWDF